MIHDARERARERVRIAERRLVNERRLERLLDAAILRGNDEEIDKLVRLIRKPGKAPEAA